ncbi:MAG: FAD-dependent oxidoreductase [Gemmatimonadales bacterium]
MTQALIIGGGIAGPVAAMALERAGIHPIVYEAYSSSAYEAGAFLTIAVNGLAALRTLGLDRPVMARGFSSPTIEFRSGTGKRLGTIPVGGTLEDGTVSQTIRRADLYAVLYDAARRRGIRVEHGKRLVDAAVGTRGVVARFADGSEAAGDLLIGADGIHSRVRRLIDPAAPEPRHLRLGNIGGYAPAGLVSDPPGHGAMIFGKRAFFGYFVSPSGEIWWFANPRSAPGAEPPARPSDLAALFRDDAGPAARIIEGATTVLTGRDQHDLPRVPAWSRGPLVIIGDAAHAASPSSGQGASLAIEDALVLAQCLRDVGDPARAFAAYERLRRPRVERVVAFGARTAGTKTPGPIGRAVRDFVLPIVLRRFAQAPQEWLYGYRVQWESRVTSDARAA